MPFEATPRQNYGGPLVTQKYSPLEDMRLRRDQRAECAALFTARATALMDHHLFPAALTLTADWKAIHPAEVGMGPPAVVISSNRSTWMANALANAAARLEALDLRHFNGVADLRALSGDEGVSPPIYAPQRLTDANGAQLRNVYIVVHAQEQAAYRTALSDFKVTGVEVVGWDFASPKQDVAVALTGFGATRYAAIAFCKALRAGPTGGPAAPWRSAWLFDDNVVGLTGDVSLRTIEAALSTAITQDTNTICAGLRGGTKAEPRHNQRDWAVTELRENRGTGVGALARSEEPPTILQQAVLWNIARMEAMKLNFSPIFVASGEDLSLTRFIELTGTPYLFYEGVKVLKEAPNADADQGGAHAVNRARQRIEAGFANGEDALEMRIGQDELRLDAFVNDRVMPHAQGSEQERANPRRRRRAYCQAVEQLMVAALEPPVDGGQAPLLGTAEVGDVFILPATRVPQLNTPNG